MGSVTSSSAPSTSPRSPTARATRGSVSGVDRRRKPVGEQRALPAGAEPPHPAPRRRPAERQARLGDVSDPFVVEREARREVEAVPYEFGLAGLHVA